jgi:hypothetical protein
MPLPDESPPTSLSVSAVLGRMRRRSARLGFVITLLSALAAALVIFAVCACKSAGRRI